jgi:ABC-2 type transport system ATP-binding protein
MNSDIILYTERLTKRFKTITAVEDLNLSVSRGDIFGFLGPNGAGKSTTIRMILGLIKPTKGEIKIFNRSPDKDREFTLKKIGALVEEPSFYDYLSARRNLEIFSLLTHLHPDRREIDRVLEIVALIHRADDKVKTFSHGMKQRLGIAQALLGRPELIILDEPTAGLDPEGMREIRRLIIQLAHQGFTIFLSSHLLHEVEQMCQNMAIINKGKLLVQGSVEQLLKFETALVSVKVDRSKEAADLLKTKDWIRSVETTAGDLRVETDGQNIPAVAELLVKSGFHIFAIQPRRSLEDYFLSILRTDHV